jgi:hypothetical protein
LAIPLLVMRNGRRHENFHCAYPLVHSIGNVLAAGPAPSIPLTAGLADLASLQNTGIYPWPGFQVH